MATAKKESKPKTKMRKVKSSVHEDCILTMCEGPDGVIVVKGTKCPPGYMKKVRDKVKEKGIRFLEEA